MFGLITLWDVESVVSRHCAIDVFRKRLLSGMHNDLQMICLSMESVPA